MTPRSTSRARTAPPDAGMASLMVHRRRALRVAAGLLAPYVVLDALNHSAAAAAARTAWVTVLLLAAAAQDDARGRRADWWARSVGVVSGVAATVIVASSGGSRGLNFGFLYAAPFCALVLVPDLLSCAALAGVAATAGGCVLLLRDHESAGAVAQWLARSASLGGIAGWGTVLYRRMMSHQVLAHQARADALAQAARSEANFRAAFTSTALGALIVSMDGLVTVANAAAREMLGSEALEGRPYFDLLDSADVEAARVTLAELRAGSASASRSRRFRTAGGQLLVASVHAAPLQSGAGEAGSVIAIIEDVTERERLREQLATSEALFRDLAERAAVGVYVVQDGVFEYVNPRLAEIFGYRRDELIGCASDVLTHADDRALVKENVRRRIDQEVTSLHFEFRGLKRGGEVVDVAVFGTRTSHRSRPAIIGTLLDMTERNRAAEERIRMQKLESLGVLAGGIAHDFNNLLAVILGDVSVAKEQAGADELLREVLDEAEVAAGRARALTAQLLTFSRGGEPVKKPVQLGAMISASGSLALRGSTSTCECHVPPELWPVLADEGQLGQVMHNLVLNAVQAMPDGGVITLAAENLDPDRARAAGLPGARHVRVTVSDTGPGVPAAIADRVFDPYFTTKKWGSGLGLATAHSIIVRHGGQIGLEDHPAGGARFWFVLPAGAMPEQAPAASRQPGRAATGRVVVMDDDDLVRRAAMRMVASLGYEPLGAADGDEVLAVCARERALGRPIAAALMDLTVPQGMGGAQAVRLLAEREPAVKAIVSSGYSSDPVMADHARHGFAGVLAKPYSAGQLREVLSEVLGAEAARHLA